MSLCVCVLLTSSSVVKKKLISKRKCSLGTKKPKTAHLENIRAFKNILEKKQYLSN